MFLEEPKFGDSDKVITSDNATDRLNALVESLGLSKKFARFRSEKKSSDNPFACWQEWGAFLREKYDIHQYMMVLNAKYDGPER